MDACERRMAVSNHFHCRSPRKSPSKSGRKASDPVFHGVLFVRQSNTKTATVLFECERAFSPSACATWTTSGQYLLHPRAQDGVVGSRKVKKFDPINNMTGTSSSVHGRPLGSPMKSTNALALSSLCGKVRSALLQP